MKKTIQELRTYFETGDRPTQGQFWDWLDSFIHKDEGFVISAAENTSEGFKITFSNGNVVVIPTVEIPESQEMEYINGLVGFVDGVNEFIATLQLTDNNFSNQYLQEVQQATLFIENFVNNTILGTYFFDNTGTILGFDKTVDDALSMMQETTFSGVTLLRLSWSKYDNEGQQGFTQYETTLALQAGTYGGGVDSDVFAKIIAQNERPKHLTTQTISKAEILAFNVNIGDVVLNWATPINIVKGKLLTFNCFQYVDASQTDFRVLKTVFALPVGRYGLGVTDIAVDPLNYVVIQTDSSRTDSKNLFSHDLTLTLNRTHNLGAKKIKFTNGDFEVPTLTLTETSENSKPNKIWTSGNNIRFTDKLGVNYTGTSDKVLTNEKTGQENYSKVIVINPTTKEQAVRDFADPKATTLAIQNATTAQKTVMRTSILGSAVASPPTITGSSRVFFNKGVDEYTDIYGLNLTLLEPSFIYIQLADLTRIYAIAFYNLTSTAVRVLWNIPVGTPDGIYNIKIQNGVTVQGLSQGQLYIGNYTFLRRVILASEWTKRVLIDPSTSLPYTDNTVLNQDLVTVSSLYNALGEKGLITHAIKSPNILGISNSDVWEVEMTIQYTSPGGSGVNLGFPFLGLTPTKDSDFSLLEDLVLGEIKWIGLGVGGQGYTLDDSSYGGALFSSGLQYTVKYTKPIGNIIYIKIYRSDSNVVGYAQSTIVTAPNPFAIYVRMNKLNYSGLQYEIRFNVNIKQ